MADWYLNRALTNYRAAVNAAYPNRDKASDGTIGDPAHAARTSDHNPDTDGSVDAWDMDVDLGSGNDAAAIAALKRVFEAHESSKYWIHNDQISFRDEGWRPRSYAYAGPNRNKHTQHVHWNTRESHEDSTTPWILEDDMTDEDRKILRAINARLAAFLQMQPTLKTSWSANPNGVEQLPAVAALAGVDLDPAELALIQAAAQAGAASAADDIVTRVLAGLPEGTLTRDDVAAALREVLLTGAGPQA